MIRVVLLLYLYLKYRFLAVLREKFKPFRVGISFLDLCKLIYRNVVGNRNIVLDSNRRVVALFREEG